MSKEVLNRHWRFLKLYPNVLNVALATKWKDGKDTKVPSITVYVSKKHPEVVLAPEEIIPKEVDGVPTDVVELAPTTWQAGKTSISELHPEDQLRRLGFRAGESPKFQLTRMILSPPVGQSDLIKWANEIQDQKNCGACVWFDLTGVWEACIKIAANDPKLAIKLSEAHGFFCTPGASCDNGTTPEDALNQAMKGVCLESCLPYVDHDIGCGQGICKNWWLTAKRISAWVTIIDPQAIKSLLDKTPLMATMSVHQSFMNYMGGTYRNLGPQDPIVGGHGIGQFGYSDKLQIDVIRNSWTTQWGQDCIFNGIARPGYCTLAYGELDSARYSLTPDSGPVPAPPTPVKTCCPTLNFLHWRRGNKGG